ncbi:hypothetical protein AWV80_19440 [Cupriavidus sp. UYMU48A]|nr:hypothetical protein AWV80_19440 [Cupriavidus sp. UYMU48A]
MPGGTQCVARSCGRAGTGEDLMAKASGLSDLSSASKKVSGGMRPVEGEEEGCDVDMLDVALGCGACLIRAWSFVGVAAGLVADAGFREAWSLRGRLRSTRAPKNSQYAAAPAVGVSDAWTPKPITNRVPSSQNVPPRAFGAGRGVLLDAA